MISNILLTLIKILTRMTHKCSQCGRVFSYLTALRSHAKTHDSKIDRILHEIAIEVNNNTQLKVNINT